MDFISMFSSYTLKLFCGSNCCKIAENVRKYSIYMHIAGRSGLTN